MPNRLSNTAVDKYIECSLCYKLHFIDRIRPVRGKSALLFGGTLDTALNDLLLNRDLLKSKMIFHEIWNKVNCETTDFSKSDLDEELLAWGSKESLGFTIPYRSHASLYIKGILFIEQYNEYILPRIKDVVAIQEPVSLKNTDGDEIYGILDLIVEWEDGKTYLLDNKSSSVKYAADSAKTGQQLPLYYYIAKDKYKLDGIGYIVMSKKINKNKVKKCESCGTICETNHKNCNFIYYNENGVIDGKSKRCGGEFEITINPTVDIEVILNQVEESDEQRVIETFDMVNQKIVNGDFALEHNPNKNKYFQYCPYKEYYEGNPDFIKLEKK